jgi:heptosyltransferase-2
VAPGTTFGEAKVWPAARLGDFLELALHQEKVRIVLLGDGTAREFTNVLKKRFQDNWSKEFISELAVVDLTGQTDLPAAARILKTASVFVGNDSGLMHLAAALGCPTVGVFGSSSPDWTAPLGSNTRVVFPAGFPCRPCYRKTCNQAEFCLDALTAEAVLAAVQAVLGKTNLTGGEA